MIFDLKQSFKFICNNDFCLKLLIPKCDFFKIIAFGFLTVIYSFGYRLAI